MITGLELPPAFEEEIGSFDPAAIDSTRSEPLPATWTRRLTP